jgi:chitinase
VKRIIALAGLVVLLAGLSSGAVAQSRSSTAAGQEVVGYFISWGIYGRGYRVKDVATSGSASKLSLINYAFGNVAPNSAGDIVCQLGDEWADYQVPWSAEQSVTGTEVTWPRRILGNFQQLQALKVQYPNVKVMISLGGWTWSRYFSDAALTAASRERLVSSCVDLFIKGNLPDPGWGGMGGPGAAAGVFDGIDLDWEWPGSEGNPHNVVRPEDKQNFTALVQEFRRQLDAYGQTAGRTYLLTAFLPAAPAKIDAGFQVPSVFAALDLATVQGYDLHGAWDPTTNHQANLYSSKFDPSSPRFSVDDTVSAYLARGAPAGKLVVGVPFYSRGWTGVAAANKGLYQPAAGAAPGTWEAGVEDYEVAKSLLGTGFVRYWDGHARTAWLFDGTTFWTFDDPIAMKEKAKYVRQNGLGGLMFWELSGDTPNGELIASIADGLAR